MKTKKILTVTSMLLIFIAAIFYACKKDNSTSSTALSDDESVLVQDDAAASSALDDAMAEVDDIGMGSTLQAYEAPSCKTAKLETSIGEWPRKITIDFGNGCAGKTGRAKSGKIHLILDGPKAFRFWYPGTYRTVTFENFKVNNRSVEGTKTITFKGFNNQGQPYWEIKLVNGKVTFKDSTWISRSFVHTRTLTSTLDSTSNIVVGEFKIEGSGSGTTRKGLNYTDAITTPLILSQNCKHIKTGEIQIIIEGKGTITLTYENNNCDGKAIIKKNGKTKEIDLD
jgi:hypothetical protein